MGIGVRPEAQTRPLSEIAGEIRGNWARPYCGAEPYLEALRRLDRIADGYATETAEMVVRYFLSNAETWRGPVARRIKAELKAMLA